MVEEKLALPSWSSLSPFTPAQLLQYIGVQQIFQAYWFAGEPNSYLSEELHIAFLSSSQTPGRPSLPEVTLTEAGRRDGVTLPRTHTMKKAAPQSM